MTCLTNSSIYYYPDRHKFVFIKKEKKLLMDASLVYSLTPLKFYNFMVIKFSSLHYFLI